MQLRRWQEACINEAMVKYQYLHSHFLCLATPGAGKTAMASILANELFKQNKIDLVMCFSPSKVVATDFKLALEKHTKKRFCGGLGSLGVSLCYHSLLTLSERFWSLFEHNRVFVIFDEIHHCAGGTIHTANAWGGQILANIQGKAAYSLALSGTPWRSDNIPIALSNYCEENGNIHCDFTYGLNEAINDGVCRVPHITALDSKEIKVVDNNEETNYRSFSDLLQNSNCTYMDVIEYPLVIKKLLKLAQSKLNHLRKSHSDAGGLIVATSVEHAKQIKEMLFLIGELSEIVTYRELNPVSIIEIFKQNQAKWIISVGMISEGTNIPRLRVCCYLSQVKTELYFRQVLGRIMRVHHNSEEKAYLFMPAHPKLMEYAQRINDDIPEQVSLNVETYKRFDIKTTSQTVNTETAKVKQETTYISHVKDGGCPNQIKPPLPDSLDYLYHSAINSLGRFSQAVFEL